MVGGATSGYCATGSARIDAIPASMITIEITHAKTGRLAKNLASMSVPRGRSGRRRRRLADRGLVGMHGHARTDLVEAFDDQLVARGEPALDEPVIADRAGRDERAELDLAIRPDDHRARVAFRIMCDA